MRLRKHVPVIESTLKRVALRPAASSLCSRCRRYASSQAYPEKVAVLGGGISGLASAYFVAKEFPKSKITIYEANNHSGGWIQSRRVQTPTGDVLFEYGARTLRPGSNALITAQLIQDLGLTDNVIFAKKGSTGAKNRYIYYPDRLQRLPSPGEPPDFWHIAELWRSGLLAGAPSALLLEPFRPKRPDSLKDESIGAFIERRMDKRVGNNMASAVMHGIYAGDIWKLSARTLLSQAWMLEGLAGSIFRGMLKIQSETPLEEKVMLFHPYDLDVYKAVREEVKLDETFQRHLNGCAMFTFEDGMAELVMALKKNLENSGQVDFKFGSWVQDTKLVRDESRQYVDVTTGPTKSPSTERYDLVVSTLRNKHLTPFVTVQTVNLYFPNTNLIPQKGFGYLIPQSVAFEENPERALGVIFDSDAIQGQDTAEGTKLTVMLGGHYWDGWEHYPSDDEAYGLAMSLLRRHLKIKEEPTHYHVNLSKDCIPQYTVGYEERLKSYAAQVTDAYKGKLRVVGSQTHGVGVNDCIRGAWDMARRLRGAGWKKIESGLERATDDRYDGAWVSAPSDQGPPKIKQ
ncbi:Protoporphyrinogen oxidase [Paraphaeosphaeria sporulosa]|uniref:Protoporphyrinogen oxidase n=1 Tax=Paraphaeosphaeria sporulosa TaxID=1460663 RepID=A0A177CVM8_9PLEO|nr:Protoporphyrinogen oxidase [Paraphaeosphaeria sporulosa]OAG11296.1 Protoporphyrinogen oxidase [Paraphaeosphaeria sporulosa]